MTMKGKTNKQLLKMGLAHFEIMELLQEYIQELDTIEINSVGDIDTSYDLTLEVEDGIGRTHYFVMYLDEEADSYSDKIHYYTEKDGDMEAYNLGKSKNFYRNSREFASISATVNNFVKVLGL